MWWLAATSRSLPRAEGHNWLFTPSRSKLKASTVMPCIPRKATDTHAQVGPGQGLVVKWATGHAGDGGGGTTLITVVHGDDYEWLSDKDFTKWSV